RPAAPGERPPDPRDLLRVQPWRTLSDVARAVTRDRRLRLVIERFATYAGADPRRAPAALALAGYVEHAFGAWHVRGGIHALIQAMARRAVACGADVRTGVEVRGLRLAGGRVAGVEVADGGRAGGGPLVDVVPCDALVFDGDAVVLEEMLGRRPRRPRERSLSGFALLLGVRGRTDGLAHHTIAFPADYGAEFDDVFRARRPVRDPTLYVSASAISDPGEAPDGDENWFVLANAPSGGVDWAEAADAYEEHLIDRLAARGLDVRGRVAVRARRTPADIARETGAPGGAIYGAAPHGRLASLRRPGPVAAGPAGVFRVGGTAHPGGGLPLVVLGAGVVAGLIGTAQPHVAG
ncbi:MAG TPA: hypothetical protein VK279_06225, partial [Solirubrobacteraceae bacterium]|nr:hypothetical protein [Solirubrobacteraceae bacterium]